MESTISLVLIVGEQLVDLISWATKKYWKARSRKSPLQSELQDFRTRLQEYLQYVKNTLSAHVDSIGFTPKSLEILLNELQNFLLCADDLFNKTCKKDDIRDFRERVMGTFQCRMACAQFEVQLKSYSDIKAIRAMLAEKQQMDSKKHGVHITILKDQACSSTTWLTNFLSFVDNMPHPADTFWERFNSELNAIDLEHPNAVIPTQASQVDKAGTGMFKEDNIERSHRLIKNVGEEGMEEVKEKIKKREEVLLHEEMEKKGQRTTSKPGDYEERDNPNRNMQLHVVEEGEGKLHMYEYKGGQFELMYQGYCGSSMGVVIGEWPMEVSKKLGYFYFEIKLVEMAEISQGRDTRLAGVGVGLARLDKLKTNKMAGKYSKSCGYDSRVGEVFDESRVQKSPPILGYLAEGDTLGIGLLPHGAQCPIFFVKNGVFQLCIQDHSLCNSLSSHGLLPVISLASAHVRLHVNFFGPFLPAELVEQVKASLIHK